MGKALHGLVFVILVLSIVALVFANMLFNKRELLMKRNATLEEQVVSLAKTFEAKDAEDAAAPELQMDKSEVADRVLDNPDKENLLEGYPMKLEQQNLPTMDLSGADKRLQLRNYFAVDSEGKYVLDPVDQKPATKGPGTMRELLDKVLDRAKAQQANLNKTRAELTKKREQLTDSVGEINKLKTDGRLVKKDLTDTKKQVADLTSKNEELEGRIAKLNSEKKELSAELADCKNENEKLNEDKAALTEDLASSKKTIVELKKRLQGSGERPAAGTEGSGVAVTQLTAGDKGKIIASNDELKFVIVEFTQDAINEMLGPDRQKPLPQLEMNIRRVGRQSAAGEFVTRIKLRQAVNGKNLVVADILNDWQQAPVEKGDVVFF
jgi:myosin heavy subunit